MENKKLIYSLVCPFTNETHYVGKTTQGMLRPLSHLRESHSEKVKEWVEALKELNHTPIVKIIEHVNLEEDLDGRERYWIQYYINKGNNLLNIASITPLSISPNLDDMLAEGEDTPISKIATFVKLRRKAVNLTQEEFAEKSGVALTVVRKIEQGKTNMNLESLLQILKMFGCSIEVSRVRKEKLV